MVDLVSVLVSVIASVVASVGAVEYRYRREDIRQQSEEIENWYAESARFGNAIQTTWRNKFQRPLQEDTSPDLGDVQREMDLYSSQLSGHLSNSTTLDVSEEVVEALEDTLEACREVSELQLHLNSLPEFEEQDDEVMDAASNLEETALSEL